MPPQKTFGLGSEAPDFDAETTVGPLNFHKWKGSQWTIFFSFPGAFTPVCTTDIGAIADLQETWNKKNVRVIGLSCSTTEQHNEWVCDINNIMQCKVEFPIISDSSRNIAQIYNMLDWQEPTNVDKDNIPYTHRSVYIIDPKNIIRAITVYPLSTGRNFDEILRVLDSLILYDTRKFATASKWKPGNDVFILGNVSDEEAKKNFKGFKKIKEYYRTIQPIDDPPKMQK